MEKGRSNLTRRLLAMNKNSVKTKKYDSHSPTHAGYKQLRMRSWTVGQVFPFFGDVYE